MQKHSDLTEKIMDRIETGEVRMRPKWHFVLVSAGLIIAVIGLAVTAVFLTSLISFSLRTHGPMGSLRLQQLLSNFPWWAPVLGIIGLISCLLLLKKFDFSYKTNFFFLAVSLIIAVILAGLAIDRLGLDSFWSGRSVMRQLYRQYDGGFRPDHFGPGGFGRGYSR